MNKLFLFLCVPVFLLFSCSNHVPEVQNINWELCVVQDSTAGSIYEELILFFQVDDGDGIDDIEELYLIYDEGLKYWQLTPETWIRQEIDGTTWIGSARLISRASFERGTYRYIVIDKSGDRTEADLFLDVNKPPAAPVFASAEITDRGMRIQSPVTNLFVSVFNEEGDGIHLAEAGPGNYRINDIIPPNAASSASYIYLMARKPEEGYILKSGPFYLKNQSTLLDTSEN